MGGLRIKDRMGNKRGEAIRRGFVVVRKGEKPPKGRSYIVLDDAGHKIESVKKR